MDRWRGGGEGGRRGWGRVATLEKPRPRLPPPPPCYWDAKAPPYDFVLSLSLSHLQTHTRPLDALATHLNAALPGCAQHAASGAGGRPPHRERAMALGSGTVTSSMEGEAAAARGAGRGAGAGCGKREQMTEGESRAEGVGAIGALLAPPRPRRL